MQKYILYGNQRGSSKKFPTILAPVIFIHTMQLSNMKLESIKPTLSLKMGVLRFKKKIRKNKIGIVANYSPLRVVLKSELAFWRPTSGVVIISI